MSENGTEKPYITKAQFTAVVIIVVASAVGLGLFLAHVFGI